VSTPSTSALPTRLRALTGDDAEDNPYLRIMRYAAVASLVAGLLLLVSGVTTSNTSLVVLAVVALLWTGIIQVGWWVICALVWERAQD
jgi:Na+/proline symporter